MIEKPKTKTSPARKPKSVTTFRERRTWSYRSSDGGGAQRNWIAASLSHQPNLSKSKFTINFSFKHEYALWTRTRREIESETGESKQWRTLQRLLSFLSLLFSFSKNFLGKQTVLRGQKVKEEGFKNFKRKSALSVWREWNGVEARVVTPQSWRGEGARARVRLMFSKKGSVPVFRGFAFPFFAPPENYEYPTTRCDPARLTRACLSQSR